MWPPFTRAPRTGPSARPGSPISRRPWTRETPARTPASSPTRARRGSGPPIRGPPGTGWRRSRRSTTRPTCSGSTRTSRRAPSNPRSGPGGELLDGPAVAVGIAEEDERTPRELLDVPDLDPALDQFGPCGVDVRDNQLKALHGARLHLAEPGPQGDRARRPRRGELDEADPAADRRVLVQVEAGLLGVEGDGAIDVRDGDLHQFQPPVHDERHPTRGADPVLRGPARVRTIP